jgi:hypothetical protein
MTRLRVSTRSSPVAWYGAAVDLTPDQVFNELRRIRGRLDTLQPGASERAALEARRDELRRQAAATSNATRSMGTLRIELDHLRTRLADLDAERVEVPAWQRRLTADGRFCLTNPLADAARINAVMDEATAHDRAAILARIAEIEEALDE